MEIPDHLTCSLRNLYAGQEATVRIRCRTIVVFVSQLCPTLCNPWTIARQAPLSIAFSRKEYWSGKKKKKEYWIGLPFPFLGDLLNPEIEPGSSALQEDSLPSELQVKHELVQNWERNTSRLYVVT